MSFSYFGLPPGPSGSTPRVLLDYDAFYRALSSNEQVAPGLPTKENVYAVLRYLSGRMTQGEVEKLKGESIMERILTAVGTSQRDLRVYQWTALVASSGLALSMFTRSLTLFALTAALTLGTYLYFQNKEQRERENPVVVKLQGELEQLFRDDPTLLQRLQPCAFPTSSFGQVFLVDPLNLPITATGTQLQLYYWESENSIPWLLPQGAEKETVEDTFLDGKQQLLVSWYDVQEKRWVRARVRLQKPDSAIWKAFKAVALSEVEGEEPSVVILPWAESPRVLPGIKVVEGTLTLVVDPGAIDRNQP